MQGKLSVFSSFILLMLITSVSFMVGFQIFPFATADLSASSGTVWSILVGISDYKSFDDLRYCDDDAKDLYNQLAPTWGANHISLLTDANANKTAIHDAIFNWLASAVNQDDTVLFFFSGHGGQGTDVTPIDEADGKDEYICPYDSLTSSWANDIRDDELDTWLSTLASGKIVVILDTCESGGFINSMAEAKGELGKTATINVDEKFGVLNDGFVKDLSKETCVVLSACAENESSVDSGILGNGVFSYYVIDALSKGSADLNANLEISAEEIFAYAEPRTVAFTTENSSVIQHPQMSDGSPSEISLLTAATITLNTDSPMAYLSVDGTTYSPSQLPKPFIWGINSTHNVNVPSMAYFAESPHPYPNYCNSTWNITHPDSAKISVHFNYVRTERNYDYVRILDGTGSNYANYTGSYAGMWSVWVPGDTIQVRLTSDFSNGADGFIIDGLQYADSVDHITQEYRRYAFSSWSDGNTSVSRALTVNESKTYTATYNAEYYLSVNSSYSSTSGQDWYANGTAAYATLTGDTVDHGNGTRRVFANWGGDASGNQLTSDAIIMDNSKTAITNWKTQYRATFAVTPGVGGTVTPSSETWIDEGGSPMPISASASSGYRFSSWSATTGITIANTQTSSTTATITTPGTITANFVALPTDGGATTSGGGGGGSTSGGGGTNNGGGGSSTSGGGGGGSSNNGGGSTGGGGQVIVEPKKENALVIYIGDLNNTPLEGVTVLSTSQPEGQTVLSGTTNSSGYLTFKNVAEGSYSLQASKNSFVNNTVQAAVLIDKTTSVAIELQSETVEPVSETQPIALWQVVLVISVVVIALSTVIALFIRRRKH